MEGYAARPYEWIYLLSVLDRTFAVDTRNGARLSITAEAWDALASGRLESDSVRAGVAQVAAKGPAAPAALVSSIRRRPCCTNRRDKRTCFQSKSTWIRCVVSARRA